MNAQERLFFLNTETRLFPLEAEDTTNEANENGICQRSSWTSIRGGTTRRC